MWQYEKSTENCMTQLFIQSLHNIMSFFDIHGLHVYAHIPAAINLESFSIFSIIWDPRKIIQLKGTIRLHTPYFA